MSFADSISQDFAVTDDTQTVALKDNAGNLIATVQFADPQSLSEKEVAISDGVLQYGDRRWFLGRTQLPSNVVPLGGWSITAADGSVWELIGDGLLDEFRVSWACVTRKAR